MKTSVSSNSDANSTNANGNNHHLQIKVNNISFVNQSYDGYQTNYFDFNFNASTVNGLSVPVVFSSIDDLGADSDYQAVPYVSLTYARSLF